MNDVIIDTNIVIWYFTLPRLPSVAAQEAVEQAQLSGKIIVPSISIVELTYLIEKHRVPSTTLIALQRALDEPSSAFEACDLNREIGEAIANIPRTVVADMPDRIIAATALSLGLPLITSDGEIRKLANIQTIW